MLSPGPAGDPADVQGCAVFGHGDVTVLAWPRLVSTAAFFCAAISW